MVYTVCIKYRNFYKNMVIIKTNLRPILLEMDQSKSSGINGLKCLNIYGKYSAYEY